MGKEEKIRQYKNEQIIQRIILFIELFANTKDDRFLT